MNRDETIALFERCEAARAEAKKAALAEGKSEDEARDIAHEAAKAVWNGWAEPLLTEHNRWFKNAKADFTRVHFLVRHARGTQVDVGEVGQDPSQNDLPITVISLEDNIINFSGFIFPDYVWFKSAIFSGDADFGSSAFSGDADFGSATFSGYTHFSKAIFSTNARFGSATFSRTINFRSTTFSGDARFGGVAFSGDADFGSVTFSNYVRFGNATFSGKADFRSATFSDDARFGSAAFSGDADFESAAFSGIADFRSVTFSDDAWFESATFSGKADFGRVSFSDHALFKSATFSGKADFAGVTFSRRAWFDSATFSREADFGSVTFSDSAGFNRANFSGEADFGRVTFSGYADFMRANFSGKADFGSVTFSSYANFVLMTLSGNANFDLTTFSSNVDFVGATFSDDARFGGAIFSANADFGRVVFSSHAIFIDVTFASNAFFIDTVFQQLAYFDLSKFDQYAAFAGARLLGPVSFNGIRGERAFSMEDAYFEHVPDFIQAHFEEAPRLDNMTVEGKRLEPPAADDPEDQSHWLKRWHRALQRRWYWYRRVTMADRDIPARWRALKRLAIQAHDQDREHEFFARELRSERFARDWPLPLARPHFASQKLKWANGLPLIVWRTESWLGFFRFWFGKFYGLTSNYGRSVLLPGLWWGAGVLVAAMFYLGEVDGMRHERQKARADGAISGHVTTALDAWFGDGRPCYEPPKVPAGPAPIIAPGQVGIIGLSQELRGKTTASYETLQLALRDGFLILYGDADTAHRTYGCLYGVELYGGGTPVAIVPPDVAFWSAMHKLWSAVMIFLFGLALRNMLKMK